MKRLIALTSGLLLAACTGLDPMPAEYAQTEYIIDLQGNSQQQIYQRSRQWAAETYVDANEVIKYASKEEGKIIAKGMGTVSDMVTRYYSYTLVIDIKPNKARLTFKDVQGVRLRGIYPPSFGLESQRNQAFAHFRELKAQYANYITKQGGKDW